MKALDRGQTPTITPDLTDELFVVQVDADGVARDGRASIGTLLEATASSQYARPSSLMMAGAISETIPRYLVGNTASIVTGKEHLTAIWLPAGATVTTITYRSSGTAAATSSHCWFSLRDSSRNLLGITSNDTAASPWPANTSKSLNLASPYAVTTSGWYYVGVMVSATTVPTLVGMATSATYQLLEPVLHGRDDTNAGLTTPATAPATSASLASASGGVTPWAWVS